MVKKILLVMMVWTGMMGLNGKVKAQHTGIRFEQGSWEEVRKKAQQEEKLIFADFFTEWCGPCLAMAEEVFPQMEVGNFYNSRFVNVKIDAEKGEGKQLREQYQVVSYPTYLFIDPYTEEVVHRSSSRQDAATFLFTGRSAITEGRRLPDLEKEYAAGNRSRELLENYMDYLASVYKREQLLRFVEEYTAIPGFSLKNREDWRVFLRHIEGVDSPQFKELVKNREQFIILYGEEEVDAKLYREFNRSLDTDRLRASPDFKGKAFLLKKNTAEQLLRKKEYAKAIPVLDALMADPGEWKEELCHYLKFTARSALYGEHPDFWLKKCVEMAQYVAYNSNNRQDPGIHYDYALILEKRIRCMPGASEYFPASVVDQPPHGVKNYSLRSPKLKKKPVKK